jgi:chemotaxis protein methyltransferase CheR
MTAAERRLLGDAQYRMLCDLVRSQFGLSFGEESRYLVEKRVARRIASLGSASTAAYLHDLRRGDAGREELLQLVDELTTNETYFFRELRQLRALVHEVLPERRLREAGHPVQVWSAGCSSGEEPYSVVMMALEAGLVPGRDLRVYASDVAPSVLTRARRGVYRPSSFRETPDALRDKYFVEKDGLYHIHDDVKRHVDFIRLNLLDDAKMALLGRVDVVLCRNVIIYFDASTKGRVIRSFYDRLRPGGYLLLGHSESLVTLSTAFELCHLREDLVYRRAERSARRVDPWHQLAEEAAADAAAAGRGQP